MSRVRAQSGSARHGRGCHRHAPRPSRPRRGDAAAAERPVRAPDQAGRGVVRRGARSRRPDRARRDRVPRPDGDRRHPVLEVGPRRANASPPRDPPPQPRGESGDGDHPRAARPARSGRPRQAALQLVPGDRPGVRAAATTRRRHAGPRGNQHLHLRSLRCLRGDQPRLPRDRRGRRGRLDGWRGHAPILTATRGGRARLAARQRSDPPGAVLIGGTMRKPLVLVALVLVVVALAFGGPGEAQRGPLKIGFVDALTQRRRSAWIVRPGWASSQPSPPFGKWVYDNLGYRKIAMIGYDFAFGWEGAAGFQRPFEEAGGQVLQKLWPPLGTADFAPYITRLRRDVDAIYAVFSGADALRFAKQLQESGLREKLALIGGGTLTDEHVLRSMGDEVLGVVTALHYSAVLPNPANQKFARAYEAKYKQVPSYYSEGPYVAGMMLRAALEATGGDVENGEKFSAALRRVDLSDAPRGPVRFDDFGNPVENIYVRKVERVGGRLQNTIIHTRSED